MEIDRLNDNISDLERAKENQKKDIELYDRQLRIKLEELRERNAIVEEQEQKIKELEKNPEICELDDKLLKMEKEKDSLKFDIKLYDAQLRIEIEKRREIQLAINMLQKEKTDLVCTVEDKEESIKELKHEKETFNDTLKFLKEQKPLSDVEVIKRTKMLQSRLLIESEKNKELEDNILALKEEVKCLKKTKEKCSNEAKQLEFQKNKMIATLQKQMEDLHGQWKTDIDKAMKHEEDKRIIVIQHRDEIIQTVHELNTALKKKENEATMYAAVCNQMKGMVENLEKKLLQKTKEVQTHSEANSELAEKIAILEENISALLEEIKCLEKKNQISLNEAKQQREDQEIKMNATLQKQKEDIDSQWKIEIDKAIKHEKEKRIIVSQQRDEMVQTVQELNSALDKKDNEATEYADVCNQLTAKVESLEQQIGILETRIQDQLQDVTALSAEQLKRVETARMLEDRGSETRVQTDFITAKTMVINNTQKVLFKGVFD